MSSPLHENFTSYRHILVTSAPLVLSQLGVLAMQFVDVLFLSWYSQDALAAVGPALMCSYVMLGLLLGIVSYTSTFVAQYVGAGRPERAGGVVWQGVYLAIIAGLLIIAISPLSDWFFSLVGHAPELARLEATYFRIMCYGAPAMLVGAALSGFFSGRSDNTILMLTQIAAAGLNAAGDYLLVFGRHGFPEMGIAGAAWATVTAQCFIAVVLGAVFLARRHREKFHTWSDRGPDWPIMRRLLAYGTPAGVRMVIEIFAWTLFMLFIGRVGTHELAVSNIALRINGVAFFPCIGVGVGVAALVGQAQGASRPDLAARVTWRGVAVCEAWMVFMAAIFLFAPRPLISLFHDPAHGSIDGFEQTLADGTLLLRFVAAYCVLDAMNIVVMSALQGAGDTRWTLGATVVIYIFFLAGLYSLDHFAAGLVPYWTFATAFVMLLGATWLVRFMVGPWRTMRVIEHVPADLETSAK